MKKEIRSAPGTEANASAATPEEPSAGKYKALPVKVGPAQWSYRGWHIHYDPPPIPIRSCDYQFAHDDYDMGDPRYGHAESLEAACIEIDDYETNGEP